MDMTNDRNKLLGAVAAAALLAGVGGIVAGRTILSSDTTPTATDASGAEESEEGGEGENHGPEGFVPMNAERLATAGIKTERTAVGSLGAEVLAQASVAAAPEGEASLTARADGAVTRITKRLGDAVRAGEPLAYLASREAAAIAAERSTATARVTAARASYARERRLFDQKVTARQDLEAAQAALAEAEAEARRTQAAATASGVTRDGRSLVVTSPISGRVTALPATLGAFVEAGTELFRIADPRRIQINAAVSSTDAQRIRAGDPAEIEVPGGGTVPAVVRSTTPSLDVETRTATVVLVPTGTLAGLQPGQSLRARITPKNAPSTSRIVLPEEAVQSFDGSDVVFVQQAKGFQAIPVTAGARSGGRIEIVGGLKPGAVVATTGAFLLKAEVGKGEAEH
jgi:cobalt-zinc-cadmium efflux system membrane fusion protein